MQTEIRIEAKRSARPTRGLEVFRTVLTRATRPVPQETIDSAFAAQSFTRLYQRLFQYQDEIDEVEGVGSVGLAEVAHYLASAALLDWPHHSSLPVPRARPMRLARRRPLSVLHRELCLALDAAPVEDGMRHPGEEILQEAIRSYPQEMGTWLSSLIFHEMTASTGASILRLVGRHQELPSSLREELVTRALAGVDVELRDAAVQAVDQWGDTKLLRMLRQHREPAIWIREYLERVIADLEAAEP
jgi:hypothetical protein